MTPLEFDRVVEKFGMAVSEGGNHRKANFYHEGRLILRTLRSRSPKDFPGYVVQKQLKISQEQLREAIRCTFGLDEYVEVLKEKGFI